MLHRKKLVDVELSCPPTDIEGLDGYVALEALVRLHGTPIGYVQMPVIGGRCTAAAIRKTILDQHSWAIIRHLVSDGLATPQTDGLRRIADLVNVPHPVYNGPFPLVTVAVCTRDRTADLVICLDALDRLDRLTPRTQRQLLYSVSKSCSERPHQRRPRLAGHHRSDEGSPDGKTLWIGPRLKL